MSHVTIETKPMDQVGEEAAALYDEHYTSAVAAESFADGSAREADEKIATTKSLGAQALARGVHAYQEKVIEEQVVQPTVDASAKHLRDNEANYHRLAAFEDYERSQAKDIPVNAARSTSAHIDVRHS